MYDQWTSLIFAERLAVELSLPVWMIKGCCNQEYNIKIKEIVCYNLLSSYIDFIYFNIYMYLGYQPVKSYDMCHKLNLSGRYIFLLW